MTTYLQEDTMGCTILDTLERARVLLADGVTATVVCEQVLRARVESGTAALTAALLFLCLRQPLAVG